MSGNCEVKPGSEPLKSSRPLTLGEKLGFGGLLALTGLLIGHVVSDFNHRATKDAREAVGRCLDMPEFRHLLNSDGSPEGITDDIKDLLVCAEGEMDDAIEGNRLWEGAPRPTDGIVEKVLRERRELENR